MNEAKATETSVLRRTTWRRVLVSFVCVAALYIGSYAANSRLGGYWLKPERDGKHLWSMALSTPTAIHWQPAYGYCARYNSDFVGYFYMPLVALDRAWIHPTMYVTEDSTFDWINHKARVRDIHPHFREEFITAQTN